MSPQCIVFIHEKHDTCKVFRKNLCEKCFACCIFIGDGEGGKKADKFSAFPL